MVFVPTPLPLRNDHYDLEPTGHTQSHNDLAFYVSDLQVQVTSLSGTAATLAPLPTAARNPLTGVFHVSGYPSAQAAIDAAAAAGGGDVLFTVSQNLTTKLTLPATVPVRLKSTRGVVLTATAAMTAMIEKPAGACTGISIELDLNANRLADRCIDIEQALQMTITGGVWSNPLIEAAVFGKSGGQVYEMAWQGTRIVGIDESRSGASPAQMPAYGYRLGAGCTDNVIQDVIVKNALVQVLDAGGANIHRGVHGFGYPYGQAGLADYTGTCSFRVTGGLNRFVNCAPDTTVLGFDLQGVQNSVEGALFYWPADRVYGSNIIGYKVSGAGNRIQGGTLRLPASGTLVGYPVQVETGTLNTTIDGLNVYGTGWLGFLNLVGSGHTYRLGLGNTWSTGTIPTPLDTAGGAVTAGTGTGITGAAATTREFSWFTALNKRWGFRANNTAESGSNQGSDFQVLAYKDDGSFLHNILQILRTSGLIVFQRSAMRARLSQTLAASGAVAFDAAAGNNQIVYLGANATSSSITNATSITTSVQVGQELTITWVQDATGSRTYVWPTNCRFAANTAPTASTAAGRRDTVTFVYENSVWCEVSRAINVPNG